MHRHFFIALYDGQETVSMEATSALVGLRKTTNILRQVEPDSEPRLKPGTYTKQSFDNKSTVSLTKKIKFVPQHVMKAKSDNKSKDKHHATVALPPPPQITPLPTE
jgi:hypothetical protein